MRTFFLWAVAIFLTVLWGSLSVLSSFIDKTGRLGHKCMRNWARGLIWAGGVKINTKGFENIKGAKNYLFVSNHQSQVDIIALSAALPVQFAFMAKKELFKIPFLGWHMSRQGYVPIERQTIGGSMQGLLKALAALKNGRTLLIFPEGTRSKDGKLKSFKDGAFYMALESGVPIVPITVNGTADILQKGTMRVNRGNVEIIASGLIKVDNLSQSDRDKLKETVRGSISSNLA